MKKLTTWAAWTMLLGGILLVVVLFSLCVGSAGIPLRKVLSVMFSGEQTTDYDIIFKLRLPRILLGFAVGGALSLSGVVLQGMFRNPLVEPYTLGISGGAALGVSIGIAFRVGDKLAPIIVSVLHLETARAAGIAAFTLPVSGFIGAAAIVAAVYFFGTRKGVLRMRDLLLTGVMISFVCSSLVMFIMAISGVEEMHSIMLWIMGSLEEPDTFLIKLVLSVSLLSLVVSYFFCLDLNALALGEEEAQHLGINVEKTKRLLFVLAAVATGVSVSVAGVIGFVGLIVPHFLRMFVGSDHRVLLIASFLTGAAFLIFCDTLARTVMGLYLPVGVVTGIVGGCVFVYALRRKRVVLGAGSA